MLGPTIEQRPRPQMKPPSQRQASSLPVEGGILPPGLAIGISGGVTTGKCEKLTIPQTSSDLPG